MYEPVEDLKGRVNALAHGMVALIDVFLQSSKRLGENETERFPLKNAREALMRAFYPQCPPQAPPQARPDYSGQVSRLDCMVRINDAHRRLCEENPRGACIRIDHLIKHEYIAFLYPADKKMASIPVSDSFVEYYNPIAPGYYIVTETRTATWTAQLP